MAWNTFKDINCGTLHSLLVQYQNWFSNEKKTKQLDICLVYTRDSLITSYNTAILSIVFEYEVITKMYLFH